MEYQTVIVYSFCWLAQCLCTLPVDVGVNCLVCRSYLSNLKMLSSSCLVQRVDQFCRFACRVHNARYSYANDLCKVMMKVCRSGIINGNCISVINTRCHLTLYSLLSTSAGIPQGTACSPSDWVCPEGLGVPPVKVGLFSDMTIDSNGDSMDWTRVC